MSTKNNNVCVLVSGGIDSAALLHEMAQKFTKVEPVYIQCGLRWEKEELYWLKKFLKASHIKQIQPLTVLSLPLSDVYGAHWGMRGKNVPGFHSRNEDVYLPGRNLLLLSKATVFCVMNNIHSIAMGQLKGNPFPDSAPGFFRLFEKAACRALTHPLKILTPFLIKKKHAVMKKWKHLPLRLTFSCLNPCGHLHCGNCNKCAERKKSFSESRIPDKTTYAR